MAKQKRSENTYQKINTIFKRDANNIIMPYDEFSIPELEYLKDVKWDCEEKVDGTNIRIEVKYEINVTEDDTVLGVHFTVDYKGKTDNANIPPKLKAFLEETYPADVVLNALGLKEYIPVEEFEEHKWNDLTEIPKKYVIYGEGYGAKIQGCGGNYLKDSNAFIGFDVMVNDLHLLRENRDEIFHKMNCPIVPFKGQMTIPEIIEFVKKGFKSEVAVSNPDFLAEGLVCRTPMGLKNRRGERIIFKCKTCDFKKYYDKYGTYDEVPQPINTEYNK